VSKIGNKKSFRGTRERVGGAGRSPHM